MNVLNLDALTRRAANGTSRRHSLLTLGGAALGATIAIPNVGRARKKGNKCQDKAKRRCKEDAANCKKAIAARCSAVNSEQCSALQACCDACSANGFLLCLQQVQS